jgi:hypothetical protein
MSREGWKAGLAVAVCAFGAALAASPQAASKCPDTDAKCLKPVKFIAKGSCLVYACQYGTPKVRLINVDAKYKAALDKLAAEDKSK